jgi:hypothetical protein
MSLVGGLAQPVEFPPLPLERGIMKWRELNLWWRGKSILTRALLADAARDGGAFESAENSAESALGGWSKFQASGRRHSCRTEYGDGERRPVPLPCSDERTAWRDRARGETADAAYVAAGSKRHDGNAARWSGKERNLRRVKELPETAVTETTKGASQPAPQGHLSKNPLFSLRFPGDVLSFRRFLYT